MESESSSRRPRRPGPARSLTVGGIAHAAILLADARGLDAVTMRSVAADLHTSAAALYRYVSSRDELVGHMVDQVSAELDHPAPTGDWVSDLTVVAGRQRDLVVAHPWMLAAMTTPMIMGPHVLDHLEWALEVLETVPVPRRAKLEAIAVVDGVAALFAAGRGAEPRGMGDLDAVRHARIAGALTGAVPSAASPDLFPRVVAAIVHGLLGTPTPIDSSAEAGTVS